jgi:hypothetical protein
VALIVKVTCVEYTPVVKLTSFTKFRLIETLLGLELEHEPPPPVQDDAGMVSTGVAAVALTVCVPEHPVPNVVPEQV